jgi:uncharacterized membrane protein YqjE
MDGNEGARTSGRGEGATIGELLSRVADDAKGIAKDEVQLATVEIRSGVKSIAADTAAMGLGGVVALIGLSMLCVAAVVALAPVIPALWLRLVIMAAVYMALGAAVVAGFARRLRRDSVRPARAAREAKRTVDAVRKEVTHA